MSTTYTVRAQRDGKWWVLTAPDVDGAVAQARRLDQAPDEIRSAIAMLLDVPETDVEVVLDVDLPDDELAGLREVRAMQVEAERLRDEAARRARVFVARLSEQGMTVRDIGVIMGTSAQRAQQLLAEARDAVTGGTPPRRPGAV
jgi:predicted RNase H-like HicB family nuclease